MHASSKGHQEVVARLVKARANQELGEPSPLEMASKGGHKSIVKKLQRRKKEKGKNVRSRWSSPRRWVRAPDQDQSPARS